MPSHTISHADSLYWGNAQKNGHNGAKRGIPMTPIVQVSLGTPALGDADGVAASQSVGAGAAFLINGALASGGTVTFDSPRNVIAAWTTTSVLTITGTDVYGETMVEVSASGASHTGKKAFKTITSITSSAAITAATVGSGDVLGLPYRLHRDADLLFQFADDTEESASSTIVVADATTATGTTGDVRGTVDPNTALDGSVEFIVWYKIHGAATDEEAFGVAQFAG